MRQARASRVGFTLVELIAVVVVLSAVSITAAPALMSLSSIRDASLGRELGRRINLARAVAGAGGRPTGVRLDTTAQTMMLVQIASVGAAATPLPGITGSVSGGPAVGDSVGSLFPGSSILSVSLDPGGAHDTLWFGSMGVPHLRDGTGAHAGDLAQDAVIGLSGGRTVTVRMVTGLVEP